MHDQRLSLFTFQMKGNFFYDLHDIGLSNIVITRYNNVDNGVLLTFAKRDIIGIFI